MLALTLHPEWAFAIMYLGKNVENRDWKLPADAQRGRIAIHGGVHLMGDVRDRKDREALRMVAMRARVAGWDYEEVALRGSVVRRNGTEIWLRPDDVIRGAIVATARIGTCARDYPSPWADGGCYNWTLEDVRVLETPIKYRGLPGFWTVPTTYVARIRQEDELRQMKAVA